MPGLTGVFILTTLLAQAPISTSGTDVVVSRPSSSSSNAQAQQGEGAPAPPEERLHQFGLGASMGFGSAGGGGAFRYFFGDQLGVNASVGFYRPNGAGSRSQGSTFYVAPSMVYMLTKSHQLKDVDLRPYVGGGLNYATGGSQVRTTSNVSSGSSSLGMQVFGGVELTFLDAKSIAISAEVAHYQMAASAYSTGLTQGTNFYLMFHYYLK